MVEILFPYIHGFISFIASNNETDQAKTIQEGFPYLSYLLSVSLSQRAVLMQGKHLRRLFAGHPNFVILPSKLIAVMELRNDSLKADSQGQDRRDRESKGRWSAMRARKGAENLKRLVRETG
jgi:hypothetical protein